MLYRLGSTFSRILTIVRRRMFRMCGAPNRSKKSFGPICQISESCVDFAYGIWWGDFSGVGNWLMGITQNAGIPLVVTAHKELIVGKRKAERKITNRTELIQLIYTMRIPKSNTYPNCKMTAINLRNGWNPLNDLDECLMYIYLYIHTHIGRSAHS